MTMPSFSQITLHDGHLCRLSLSKVADFFEAEVDDAVEALSSLMEPMIMVILGTLIGGMVVAMYLPIFKLGGVV